MPGRRDNDVGMGADDHLLDVLRGRRTAHDGDIQLLERRDDFFAVADLELDFEAWVRFRESNDQSGSKILCRADGADDKPAPAESPQLANGSAAVAQGCFDFRMNRKHMLSRVRQTQAASRTLEKGQACGFLK